MAVRSEDLVAGRGAEVVSFPVARARRRAARARLVRARRRLALLCVGLIVIGGVILGGGVGGDAVASRPGAPRSVVLGPGQTLWELAERYAPQGVDPRAYVDALEQLNGLESAPQAGMALRLPR